MHYKIMTVTMKMTQYALQSCDRTVQCKALTSGIIDVQIFTLSGVALVCVLQLCVIEYNVSIWPLQRVQTEEACVMQCSVM